MKQLIVDPPSGWMYGFPKAVPETVFNHPIKFGEWLVEQGYPQNDLHLALKHSRYWEKNDG